jgi:DNA-binding NarL/FixJ family response regulator
MTRNKNRLRIVVADDHELVRRGIRDLLETQPGWKVWVKRLAAGTPFRW